MLARGVIEIYGGNNIRGMRMAIWSVGFNRFLMVICNTDRLLSTHFNIAVCGDMSVRCICSEIFEITFQEKYFKRSNPCLNVSRFNFIQGKIQLF